MESQYPHLSAKESQMKWYKPIWRTLLIFNLGLGAYMFARARQKNLGLKDTKVEKKHVKLAKAPLVESPLDPITTTPVAETPPPPPAVPKAKEPIPEDQQRELFKWMLEEKRKVQLKDCKEKKQIDEEKAILKQFINAKSIPSL